MSTPPPAPKPAARRSSATRYVAYERLVDGGDGRLCTTRGYRAVPTGLDPRSVPDIPDRSLGNILATYQPCAARPRSASSPEAAWAERFWQEVPLPSPRPRIAPGWAITGMPAYLETNGATTHRFVRDTPFGPMDITASGSYLVDWGDGTTTGPHSYEGRPWPEGRISHVYTWVGHYDVVVTERWSAEWRIGSETGTLSQLTTAGRIGSFRVEQVQAVVTG